MGKSKKVNVPAGHLEMWRASMEQLETEKSHPTIESRKELFQKKRLACISCVLLVASVVLLMIFVLALTGVIVKSERTKNKSNARITEEEFGELQGKPVKKFNLWNTLSHMAVEVLTYGGTIHSIRVPDKHGNVIDVVLGFDNLQGYASEDNPYFGALVGRYANRLANGRFEIDGKMYHVTVNNNGNSLHGGVIGWNKAIWDAEVRDGILYLSHVSPDGDQGFPGNVVANLMFELTDYGELCIKYSARTDKATPINLTTHPYFNLAGEGTASIYSHNVTIHADRYTPVTSDLIPTGDITSVDGTVFDLRRSTQLGSVISNVPGGGFDHNFAIRGPTGNKIAAKIHDVSSGIEMTVYTNQPGMQFYTGNFLDLTGAKNGHDYPQHSGFCMETQNYPDAPNHINFPDSILRDGSEYKHEVTYKFGILHKA